MNSRNDWIEAIEIERKTRRSEAKSRNEKYQSRFVAVKTILRRKLEERRVCEKERKKKLTRNKGEEEEKAMEKIDVHLSQQVCCLISDVAGPRI